MLSQRYVTESNIKSLSSTCFLFMKKHVLDKMCRDLDSPAQCAAYPGFILGSWEIFGIIRRFSSTVVS